ncbi:hypothetical protein QR680_007936 [Steinernema hermaphroditum]|uniref:chitin synthase n=1 Tax=Steinernema hermaphroditum TaxID=289476 RepID=A0AA39IES4_9BILA|nr:hypothetical protein QR680_007936 [Steinernema hermaphroditum]
MASHNLYCNEEYIGSGNFSSVYRAFYRRGNHFVALKKVDLCQIHEPKVREDCLKETNILLTLQHENIIRCYSSFLENGMLVIVLELADQGDLMNVINQHKARRQLIRESEIWTYFVQIMRGIDYMHGMRVMHRDIKPANVFLTNNGTVKLGDLGLSRIFSAKTNAAMSIVGTPYYMSPERIDECAYDFKSDIWSLGCMMYELAALQSPFYADKKNYVSLCSKIKFCEYPPLPADVYSQQMRFVISACMDMIASERPDSSELLLASEKMYAWFARGGMPHSEKWDAFRSFRRDQFATGESYGNGWWSANFLKLLILVWSHTSLIAGVLVTKFAILLMSSNLQVDGTSCGMKNKGMLCNVADLMLAFSEISKSLTIHIAFALLLIQAIPDVCLCLQRIYRLMKKGGRNSKINIMFVLLEVCRAAGLLIFYFFVSPSLDPYRGIIYVTLPIIVVPNLCGAWNKLVNAFSGGGSMNSRLKLLALSVPAYYAVLTALTSILLWSIVDMSIGHVMKFTSVMFLLSLGSWEYWIDVARGQSVFRGLYEVKYGLRRLNDSTRLGTSLLRLLVAYVLFDTMLRTRGISYNMAIETIIGLPKKSPAAERNVVLLGLFVTVLNVVMRWSSRFLASMGMSIVSVFNPLLVAPSMIAAIFAVACRFANICWINEHLAQFSLHWSCAKLPESAKYSDRYLILLWFFVYSLWAAIHLFKRQGPSHKKTEDVIDSMAPIISPYTIESSIEVYHYLLKRDEDCKRHDESDDSGDDEFYDYLTLYICATMWHETKVEMAQMIKSIIKLDEEQDRRRLYCNPCDDGVNFKLEAHIFFDDAWEDMPECGRVPNAYFKQLFDLLVELTLVAEDVVAPDSQRILVTTPYGGRLVMQLPAGTLLFVHLKDKKLLRHKKRWSQVMYMYYLLGHRIMDSHLTIEDRQHSADNTFIMAIDGDSKFEPESVVRLLNLMKTKADIGCACGRIHPIGNGLMVWYQKFEYAIGHWFQKAAEHVFGCVLCAPGCFSLFRASALMDDNVMHKYTKTAADPLHFGYRIEYDASSYAETFAPEGFEEFFNQRRRWTPSSVANTFDLLADYKKVCANNKNVSTLYILYQMLVIGFSMLGPSIIFSMLVFAQVAAFGAGVWVMMVLNAIPVCLFVLCCFVLQSRWQLMSAKIISIVYAFIMLAVMVATASQVILETALSPTSVFVLTMVSVFFAAALLHPHEFYNIVFGPIFFLMIPATYIFLSLYSLINLNVINWGTREAAAKALNEAQEGDSLGCDVNRYHWMDSEYLEGCEKGRLKPSEERFWCELIERYLKPIKTSAEEKIEQVKGLADLRNKVAFAILLVNGLLVLAIFLIQKHKDVLSIKWLPYDGFQWTKMNELTGKFETTTEALKIDPLEMGIIVIFMGILVVQSAGLLIHRLTTLMRALHEAAKVERIFTWSRRETINHEEIMAEVRAMIDSEAYDKDAHGARGYKRPPAKTKGAPSKMYNVLYKLERETELEESDDDPNML